MKDLFKKVFVWFDNNQKRFEDIGADYEQIVEEAITECGGENAIYTLLCPVFSKEQVVAILEKRLEDAFANQYHRNEDARLRESIDTIEALVPPSCFPNGA